MRTNSQPHSLFAAKLSTQVCVFLPTVLLIAGTGFLAASWVPFSVLGAKARSMSVHGQSTFLDQTLYAEMQFRLRVIGAANIAFATATAIFRKRIASIVQQIVADSAAFGHDLKSAISIPVIDAVTLFGLTLFAGLLRYHFLFQPIRGDEAYTFLTYASHPFYVALSFYNTPNNHIFHTLLVRLCYLLLGNHPWAFRIPVFIAGLLLVPATYFAGKCLYGRDAGLLAAGLVTASSPLIEYSTNARGHNLICLNFILLISLSAYALRKQNFAAWSLMGALAVIGFYTEPINLYPFGGIASWLLFSALLSGDVRIKWGAIKELALVLGVAAFATLELYSPVFAVSGPGAVFANRLAIPKPLPKFLGELPASFVTMWTNWNRAIPLWMQVALASGFLLALIFHRRLSRQRLPLTLATFLWIMLFLLLDRVIPPARAWLFAIPLYLIAASAGCGLAIGPLQERLRLWRATLVITIAASLLLGFLGWRSGSVYLDNEGRGMEEIAVYLKGQLQAGDSVVAVVPSDTLLLYHFQQHGVPIAYLNAPKGTHVFVIVNQQKGDSLDAVLESAKRTDLEGRPSTLIGEYETACVYEIASTS
jgi:hypothetical protein